MSIHPEGESLRNAVRWIAEEEKSGSAKSRRDLMAQAALKFNLTPMESEYLARSFEDIAK